MSSKKLKISLIAITIIVVIAISIYGFKKIRYKIMRAKETFVPSESGNNYFSLEEMQHSDTAEKYGINNTAPPEAVENLKQLIKNILNPLREALGEPVYVTSGYRSAVLDKRVGGSGGQHLMGQAADITLKNPKNNKKIWDWLLKQNKYDQIIWEKGNGSPTSGTYPDWVHVSYAEPKKFAVTNRNRKIWYDGVNYYYA
jgi:hypothetical protein